MNTGTALSFVLGAAIGYYVAKHYLVVGKVA